MKRYIIIAQYIYQQAEDYSLVGSYNNIEEAVELFELMEKLDTVTFCKLIDLRAGKAKYGSH